MGFRFDTNYNARIGTGTCGRTKYTETKYREDDFNVKATTDVDDNRSELQINCNGRVVRLSGSQARTIFRVLTKHFDQTGKSFEPVKVYLGG